ncbi:hypothetical protein RB608_01525 [Nocardioides sp. LHD-245]|uniref:hypothetical protein n=1 Tax=Nocardioides sp. LHD-245 TaxID=3051387 RepID=UPI0027E146FF|nr:hypothetical protein [Nocardioides sp. LHD-245]
MSTRGFLLKSMVAAFVVFVLLSGVVALGKLFAGPDDDPAPATKKAIAAVTVEVLGLRPTSFEVNPRYDVADPLGVEIRFRPPGERGDSHYLYVTVGETDARDDAECGDTHDCSAWSDHGGGFVLSWQEEEPEEDPGILTLAFETADGERRSVTYAGALIEGDPRAQDLPLDIDDDLVRLLTDDRLSATTTQEMVDADLPKWPEDDTRGDPVPTTPEAVAQWMLEDGVSEPEDGGRPADTTAYGAGAVGAELTSPDRTVTVVLVPQDSPAVPTCGAEWHCETRRGVVRGWQPGAAIAIRRTDDAVVIATVRSPRITALPRNGRFGSPGADYESLAVGYAADNLVTTREFAEGVDLSWFQS